jgi:hypothetical protein
MPHRADEGPYSRITADKRPLEQREGGGGASKWGCPHEGCGAVFKKLKVAWLHLEDVHKKEKCDGCGAVLQKGTMRAHKRHSCSERKANNLTPPWKKGYKRTKVHACE